LIIDPGDEADYISTEILRLKLVPQAILLTHGHFDHVLGCLELKLNFNLPIYLHQADLFIYKNAPRSAAHWLGQSVDPVPQPDFFLTDKQTINFGLDKITVIHTPGHTPGSVCFYLSNYLFTGDTLFADEPGRADHTYSNKDDLQSSLQKIYAFPPSIEILPGHGKNELLSLII